MEGGEGQEGEEGEEGGEREEGEGEKEEGEKEEMENRRGRGGRRLDVLIHLPASSVLAPKRHTISLRNDVMKRMMSVCQQSRC